MITTTSTSDTCEAILRFLFAVSDECPEAQDHLASSATAIGFLLDLIKQRQFQALGPLCNLLPLEGLKSKLPVVEIEALLVPLLNDSETEIDDVNYDRVVLLVSNLIDSEKEDHDTHDVLLEQLQDMAFAILDGTLITCGLMQVLSGINNLAVSDHNKMSIGNSDIPKVLMDILTREGPLVFAPPEDEEEREREREREREKEGGAERSVGGGEKGVGERAGGEVEEEDLESKEIKALAAKIMWSLSFHEANRKKMESNGTLQTLQRLSVQGDNIKVKRNLEGCLWLFKHAPLTSTNETPANIAPSNPQINSISLNVANTSSSSTNNTTTSNPSVLKVSTSTQPPTAETSNIPRDTNTTITTTTNTSENTALSSQKINQLEVWSIEQVKQWLTQVGLGQYGPVFEAQRIDGRALAEIAHKICDIQFLEMVEKRLEFRLFGDLMGFVHAVRKYI